MVSHLIFWGFFLLVNRKTSNYNFDSVSHTLLNQLFIVHVFLHFLCVQN